MNRPNRTNRIRGKRNWTVTNFVRKSQRVSTRPKTFRKARSATAKANRRALKLALASQPGSQAVLRERRKAAQ